MANAGTFRVQLLHSGIGFDQRQKDTLRGLGLRKRHKIVELKDTPAARGMVHKVRHLVKVLEAGAKGQARPAGPWKGAIVVPGSNPPKAKKAAKETAAKGKKSGKKKTAAKKGTKR